MECVPAGRVVSYGDLASLVGTGPRVVGRVMALYGADVCWWRVTNAAGRLPERLLAAARDHWRAEGISSNQTGSGCKIVSHRADLKAVAKAYRGALPMELSADVDL